MLCYMNLGATLLFRLNINNYLYTEFLHLKISLFLRFCLPCPMAFQYGIEHEVAFQHADGSFADFTNTQFEDFSVIIDQLPVYETDYSQLRVGDAGIRYNYYESTNST